MIYNCPFVGSAACSSPHFEQTMMITYLLTYINLPMYLDAKVPT